MINSLTIENLDSVMDIWLKSNLYGHPFVPDTHWLEAFDTVKTLLPQADVFTYENQQHEIRGFVGVTDNHYIAGIFVDPQCLRQGIGQELLTFVKRKYSLLTLDVYQKNQGAISFYLHNGFVIKKDRIDQDTGLIEYQMTWSATI